MLAFMPVLQTWQAAAVVAATLTRVRKATTVQGNEHL